VTTSQGRSPRDEVLLTTKARDGTTVRARDGGRGPVILILHPGMETGTRYKQVARILAKRFRVLRLHRRQYRLDLKSDPRLGSPCTVAEEVEHVLAIARTAGAPAVVFGHSSGGTVALEALLAAPSSFAGGVVYEPASVLEGPPGALHLAGDAIPADGGVGEGPKRARAALAAGKPGEAMGTVIRITAGWPGWAADLAGILTALFPAYRELIPCQVDDLESMERLGVRLAAYATLQVPIAMVGGERSPAHVKEMVAAVAGALPSAERVALRGQGHNCHVRDPEQLARVIETFADTVLRQAARKEVGASGRSTWP
jgi:pimeloyl-ACP methyl ester carboxylesterase